MYKSLIASDSLIESLCREIDYIRQRYKNVSLSLSVSRDKFLRKRLLEEILHLKQRRKELIEVSNQFITSKKSSLAIMFFYELCKRPLDKRERV